jgi:hypothetical protein
MNTQLRIKMVMPAHSRGGGGSTTPAEFLAMRAQQRATQARNRRLKRGGLAVGAIAGLALGAFLLPRAEKPASAHLGQARASIQAPAPIKAPAPSPVETPPAPEVAAAAPVAVPAPPCEDDFARGDWKAAIDSCTLAFEASPTARTALKTAHAYWGHGDAANAGVWADRALALGTDDADVYVLQGHSAREAGRPKDAIEAYRHYLHDAPKGWHAARVRQALRDLRPKHDS